MVNNIGFSQTNEGGIPPPPIIQDPHLDVFSLARESLENTIRELTKVRDQLTGRVSLLEAQLQQAESGQAEFIVAAVQRAVAQLKAEFMEVIAVQRVEIVELKCAVAPLQAKYQEELEMERREKERFLQERKDCASRHFATGHIEGPKQIEYIQTMNLEEIEYLNQELSKFGRRLARMMVREQWTKERMLQPHGFRVG